MTCKPLAGPVACPFTVAIDTREQLPYSFSNLKTNAKEGNRLIDVPISRECLPHGDYSIDGIIFQVGVERKSKDDLFGSVARRENFENRLWKMTARRVELGYRNTYFAVVVECELRDLEHAPKFSKMNPKALARTILAWRQRYAVDWFFVAGRERAEAYTFRILERFHKDHEEGRQP